MSPKLVPLPLQAARLKLQLGKSYYGTLLYGFTFIEMPDCPTMGVDQWLRVYYNPSFIERPLDELAACLEHECGHVLFEHTARCLERDPLAWNASGDREINDGLREAGVHLPAGALFPEDIGAPPHELAETYYDLLPRVSIHRVACGSGAGNPQSWELPGTGAEGQATGARSPVEVGMIRRQVAKDIAAAKQAGTVPGHLIRWAERLLSPQVDWRKELRAQITHAVDWARGKAEYSYRVVSRRASVIPDVVFPGMIRPLPAVAAILDVSGSMTAKQIGRGLDEIDGIAGALGLTIPVLVTDAAVHSAKRVQKAAHLELRGGGGTDMGVGMAEAQRLRPRPHVLIVLTDGETPWPPVPPRQRVIAVLIKSTPTTPTPPPWMKVIRLPG